MHERDPGTLEDLTKQAEKFLIGHDRNLATAVRLSMGKQNSSSEKNGEEENGSQLQRFNFGRIGHMQADCKQPRKGNKGSPKRCYFYNRVGHLAKDCKTAERERFDHSKAMQSGIKQGFDAELCIKHSQLIPLNSKKLSILKCARLSLPVGSNANMLVVKCKVGQFKVNAVRH